MILWVAAGVSMLVGFVLLRGANTGDSDSLPVGRRRKHDEADLPLGRPKGRRGRDPFGAGRASFVNDDTRVPLMVLGGMAVVLAMGWAYNNPGSTAGTFLHTTFNRVSQAMEESK